MDNIKDYDDEGFELEFEDDTPAEERKYYVQNYTNVNMVADRRLHCTCCDTHIGTAPSAEKIIRMHPVLRVTQCVKCFRFYNSGEFEKGEDGSELYCRWCGQGGDVYCCSDCAYVFCKKCILRNLTRVALHDVTSNDNWKCFSCAPKILYHLRAQHWALTNFIVKQKKKIDQMIGKRDQDEIADAMIHDSSTCCEKKKAVAGRKRKTVSAINSDNDSDDNNSSWPTVRKRNKKKSTSAMNDSNSDVDSVDSGRVAKKAKTANTSIVQEPVVPAIPKPSTPKTVAPPKVTPPKAATPKVATPKAATPKVASPKRPSPKSVAQKAPQPPQPPAAVPIRQPMVSVNAEVATDIDCTPDLFSYLVNHSYEQTHGASDQSENSVSSSTGAAAVATTSQREQQPISNGPRSNAPGIQNVIGGRAASPASSQNQSQRREQVVRRVARARVPQQSSGPVYHNYNGYRIDLNNAAQQSTIRLPNGKIIHVRKQSPLNSTNEPPSYAITSQPSRAPPNQSAARTVPMPRHPTPARPRPHQIQRVPTQTAMANHGPPPQLVGLQQQQQLPQPAHYQPRANLVRPSMPNHMPLQQAQSHLQMMQHIQPPPHTPHASMPGPAMQPANMVGMPPNAQQNTIQPRVYSNDQVGRAHTQLERQIFNAIQICHQIDGKLKTLMNSNAYKNVQKLHDIKELYIHLSYLFTYTNGRFQSVHDKCIEDMRRLGFKNDAKSLSSGNVIDKYGSDVDEDDLEIVEPRHQTINLDSDDERTPEKNRSKSSQSQSPARAAAAATAVRSNLNVESMNDETVRSSNAEPIELNISSSSEVTNVECDVDISALLQIQMNDDDEDERGDDLLCRMNEDVDGIATPPETEENDSTNRIENDLKLKSKVMVSLKSVEKDYPDLMKKALEKLKVIEIDDDDEDDRPVVEQPAPPEIPPVLEIPDEVEDLTEEDDLIEKSTENTDSVQTTVPVVADDPNPVVAEEPTEPSGTESSSEKEASNEHDKSVETESSNEKDDSVEIVEPEDSVETVEPSINNQSIIQINSPCPSQPDEEHEAENEKNEKNENNQSNESNDDHNECAMETSSVEKLGEPIENEAEANDKTDSSQIQDKDEPQAQKDDENKENESNQMDEDMLSEVEDAGHTANESGTIGIETSKEDADLDENEAKSVDNCSDNQNNEDQEMPSVESHSEITSTSSAVEEIADTSSAVEEIVAATAAVTAETTEPVVDEMIINDTLINETIGESTIDDDYEAMNIVPNEIINEFDTVEQIVECETVPVEQMVECEEVPAPNDADCIFSDLSDCNQMINEEINKAISSTDTLEVASFLENDDFENISSPDTFI